MVTTLGSNTRFLAFSSFLTKTRNGSPPPTPLRRHTDHPMYPMPDHSQIQGIESRKIAPDRRFVCKIPYRPKSSIMSQRRARRPPGRRCRRICIENPMQNGQRGAETGIHHPGPADGSRGWNQTRRKFCVNSRGHRRHTRKSKIWNPVRRI